VKKPHRHTLPILLEVPNYISQDLDTLHTYLAHWYSHYFDQPWQEQNPNLITVNEAQEGVKIDDIRKLQSLLSYSAGSTQHRIVIIYGFESTQPVAQNAMLKMLEEPPAHTHFILLTKNLNLTLPTITSRCVIEHLAATKTQATPELPYTPTDLLQKITASKTGELLAISEEFSDRQEATQMLESLLLYLHEQLQAKPSKQHAQQISAIQSCLNDLKSNVNVKLTLDHCWMIIQKTAL
jgi:DNA polymerase-3 subunit delta'